MQNLQSNQKIDFKGRVMNVVVGHKSVAEQNFKKISENLQLGSESLEPGFPSTPSHNLVFRGGKTIPNLFFANFYLGNWAQSDISSIDWAISAALSD